MKQFIIASAALALPVLIIGCEREDTSTTPPPPPPPARPAAAPTGDRATDALSGAAGGLRDAAGEATGGTVSAQLDQVSTYIKDNKLDLAEAGLTKVEQNKASLPANLQPRVEQLRTQLNQAKQAGGTATGGATTRPTTPAP